MPVAVGLSLMVNKTKSYKPMRNQDGVYPQVVEPEFVNFNKANIHALTQLHDVLSYESPKAMSDHAIPLLIEAYQSLTRKELIGALALQVCRTTVDAASKIRSIKQLRKLFCCE